MKRLSCALLALALLLGLLPAARAAAPNGTVWAAVYDYDLGDYRPAEDLPVVRLLLNGSSLALPMPGVILAGRTMAPLRPLAEALGAQVEWLPDAGQVTVTRRSDTIRLTLGSAVAQVNGADVTLPDGIPVTLIDRDGQGYTMVPLRAFSETFGCRVGWVQESYTATVDGFPELDIPAAPERFLIALDAGHGGYSSGAYYEGIAEKDLNLSMTQKLRDILSTLGYRTLMTREGDAAVELRERARMANDAGADLFVSIHCNAAIDAPGAEGLHVYYYPGSGVGAELAQAIQAPACAFTGAFDRGIAAENFAVVRETYMPAVLVETGFMTNHAELQRLREDTYQTHMALGIAQGIIQYLNGRG